MSMLVGYDLLAQISDLVVIPGNRIQEPLQRPRRDVLIQRHGLDVLSLDDRHQALDIRQQQCPARRPRKTLPKAV